MQYKIPQNVGIEDKIVGPLTLRQLIILAVGFGTSYVLFAIISRIYELNILEYAIIILPGAISAAFALIRINDISLMKFFFLFLEFSIKPKKRVWDHRGITNIVSPDLSSSGKNEAINLNKDESAVKKAKQAANLRELTKALDSSSFSHLEKVNHEDIDDAHDDDLVTQAYFGNKKNETNNIYWRTKTSHLEMLKTLAKLPVTQLKKGTKETEIAKREIMKVKEEVEAMQYNKKSPTNTQKSQANQSKKMKKIATQKTSKNRKRKRITSQPARPGHQVDNTHSKKPLRYNKPQNKTKNKPSNKGELDLNNLSDGDSIEINLD